MKKIQTLIFFIFLLVTSPVQAIDIEDVKIPKNPAYRFGISNEQVETEYIEVKKQFGTKSKIEKLRANTSYIKYSDLSLKKLSKEISFEIEADNETMLGDIQILWAGAAQKSETIKFAMYKLANPDADKPNEGVIKKIIRPLASLTTIASAGFPHPVIATGAILSGNLLGAFSIDDKDLNHKLTKVNDADMIILVRKIDDLQKNLVNNYIDYMSTKNTLKLSFDIATRKEALLKRSQSSTYEKMLIADAYFREAQDNMERARLNFLTKRASLEQLAGPTALNDFEDNLKSRGDY